MDRALKGRKEDAKFFRPRNCLPGGSRSPSPASAKLGGNMPSTYKSKSSRTHRQALHFNVQCSMFVFPRNPTCYFPCFIRRIRRAIQAPRHPLLLPHTSFGIREFGIRHSSPNPPASPRSTANLATIGSGSPEISPASQVDQVERSEVPGTSRDPRRWPDAPANPPAACSHPWEASLAFGADAALRGRATTLYAGKNNS